MQLDVNFSLYRKKPVLCLCTGNLDIMA